MPSYRRKKVRAGGRPPGDQRPDRERVIVGEAEVNGDENDTELAYDDNGKIKVPKKVDREKKWERKTYYLTTELIDAIDAFSEKSGHNKSAIVRMALREFFRRAEIQ